MSLLNLIVHPDSAYLVTDSGYYDVASGGIVARLGPKSMVIQSAQLIIASAGRLPCACLAKGIMALGDPAQEELLAALPGIARTAVERFKIDLESTLVFAGYSAERQRAFGGAFLTHAHGCDPSTKRKIEPYEVMPQTALLLPPLPGLNLAPLARPTAFNPVTDMMGIVEQQRRFDFGSPGKPVGCCIAGDIDVVSISADGFSVRTIHNYPATIGQKVEVDPLPQSFVNTGKLMEQAAVGEFSIH